MLRPVLLAALLVVGVAPPVSAQAGGGASPLPNPGVGIVLEGGFEFGGDEILELTFTDGDTQTIRAGQGGTFGGGVQFRPAALPRLSVAGTVGFKFTTTAADNASIIVRRVPIEITAHYQLAHGWWAGGGLAHHTAIKINGDGFVPDVEFDPATGATFEAGWRWLGVTYTAMNYDNGSGASVGANAVGVLLRWVSGGK